MGMSFGKRVYELLNKQISEEFGSSFLYMAMSAVLKDMGLDGCASWMMLQSKEKYQHAMKILEHIQERNAKVKLLPIAAPGQAWRAPLHIFEEMLRHEQKVSTLIDSIYELSVSEKDYVTQNFISCFVKEQSEKEAAVSNLLNRLRKMQSTDLGVIMFDTELARRQ
ncbi:MAG: ferritin [Holosporaceae bacterium]|jgi:ferritin|nr:ferritin [Holosporaceae bacterium]